MSLYFKFFLLYFPEFIEKNKFQLHNQIKKKQLQKINLKGKKQNVILCVYFMSISFHFLKKKNFNLIITVAIKIN